MRHPLITTVIPTYRRPRLLLRAVRSVLAQTYPFFEVHIYDNASGDDTGRVVAELAASDPRVRYHCHAENIGSVRNFCYAVSGVQTPLFTILSDDDGLLPTFFERAIAAFAKYPEAMLFTGATAWIEGDENSIRDIPALGVREGLYTPPEGFFAILEHQYTDWMGSMFKSDVLAKIGGLDPGAGSAIDTEFLCRCAARYPMIVSHELSAIYWLHNDSAGSSEWSLRWWWSSMTYPLLKFQNESWVGPIERVRMDRLKQRLMHKIFKSGLRAAIEGMSDQTQESIEMLEEAGERGSGLLRMLASRHLLCHLVRHFLASVWYVRQRVKRLMRRQMYKTHEPAVAQFLGNGD